MTRLSSRSYSHFMRTCSSENCENQPRGSGDWCDKHRTQLLRHGKLTPGRERNRPQRLTCYFDECGRAVRARNLCRFHYNQATDNKPLTTNKGRVKSICCLEDCTKDAKAKNLCSTHYTQYKRGEALKSADWGKGKKCCEPNCDRDHDARGWCSYHLEQKVRMTSWAHKSVSCSICPETRGTQRCHIVPRASGGQDEEGNIIPLCPTHHWCYDHNKLTAKELASVIEAGGQRHSQDF